MKSLQQILSEALVNERGNNPISKERLNQAIAGAKDMSVEKYHNLLNADETVKRIAKEAKINNKKIIMAALGYVDASIEDMAEEDRKNWIENMNGWLNDDFPEVFGEYLEEDLGMDEDKVAGLDLRAIADAIAGLFQ